MLTSIDEGEHSFNEYIGRQSCDRSVVRLFFPNFPSLIVFSIDEKVLNRRVPMEAWARASRRKDVSIHWHSSHRLTAMTEFFEKAIRNTLSILFLLESLNFLCFSPTVALVISSEEFNQTAHETYFYQRLHLTTRKTDVNIRCTRAK